MLTLPAPWRRYGVAAVSVAAAIGVRLALDPLLGEDKFPFAALFLAVLVAAWYGGGGPSLLALVLGALGADYFILAPRGSINLLDFTEGVGMALFIVTSAGIAFLGSRMHSARRHAEAHAEANGLKGMYLDNTFDAVLVWDWNGTITYWNRGAEQLYGHAQDAALGRVSQELLHTRVEGGLTALLAALDREGRWQGQLVHRAADGRELIAESRMVRMRQRGLDQVIEANRDITERIAALAELRQAHAQVEDRVRERTAELARNVEALRQTQALAAQQEQRLGILVDGVRDYAIFMLDSEGRVSTWNSGAERSLGYGSEEVLGRFYGVFFTPEDMRAGAPGRELAQARREGRCETEGWRCRRDGRRYWAGVLLTPLHDAAGSLIGYAKLTRDLSERRRQQDLLARVAELAPFAMLLVDERGAITMVNAEAEKTFGWSRNELLGRPLEMLVPAPLRDKHSGLRADFLRAPSVRGMGIGRELHGLRKDGLQFPIEIGLSPIESSDGTHTLAAVFDITLRRAQQLESERLLAEKETLLREVYHRVKNNLQVVQSLLTLQRHALTEGPARAALYDSVQRVRAMSLVHEKLYQSGNLAAVSLAAYAHDLMRQLAEAHGTEGRRIRLHVDVPDVHTGLDAAVPFGLLLTELVTNSLKHGFEASAGGAIHVTLQPRGDGDMLTIADDGVGFASGFDVMAPSASMGLQLAAGLAQQLGGELHTRSEGGAVVSALLTRLRSPPAGVGGPAGASHYRGRARRGRWPRDAPVGKIRATLDRQRQVTVREARRISRWRPADPRPPA